LQEIQIFGKSLIIVEKISDWINSIIPN